MLSFGAIAKVYAKKVASPDATAEDLNILYKKLYKSMLAVNDIITDRVLFAQKEDFNLNEVIQERIEAYYFPPQVSVEQNINRGELIITADKKKVGRIVGNLLDNAHNKLEELKMGELKVLSYAEKDYAVIEVGNTGNVPPEIQKNILQEDMQLTRPNREEGRLGLSIVKLFTVMHNGTVEFESLPEKNWTSFRVKLPLGKDQTRANVTAEGKS
jgi:signal transduction histidine kinase